MRIKLKNVGILREAEFELGNITIICGKNNTGKTYATYALYGFLEFWKDGYNIPISREIIKKLYLNGTISINLTEFQNKYRQIVKSASKLYSKILYRIFASKEDYFSKSSVEISINKPEIINNINYDVTFGTAEKSVLNIKKTGRGMQLEVSLLVDRNSEDELLPDYIVKSMISDAIKKIIFSGNFPNTFIASAERTGVAIFREELDFARNRLLEILSDKKREITPDSLLSKFSMDYPLPVTRNVNFIRQLESISSKKSFIAKKHPEILEFFSNIIEGKYNIKNGILTFTPHTNSRLRLKMDESSSSVRSLLDLGFYLNHVAKPGDLLIIDEPELNLHPENQRLIARLFARLSNIGIKVFITTHSDYIIKELNTLIMLNQDQQHIKKIKKNKGYVDSEIIDADKVRVYVAKKSTVLLAGNKRKSMVPTLVKSDIDEELGIEVDSFDTTINEMNQIQKNIIFGRCN
jgi:predicted ATPase